MKNKTEMRKINKALTIECLKQQLNHKAAEIGRRFSGQRLAHARISLFNAVKEQFSGVLSIPAECWRTDRPKLDARRYRKYLRGFHVISR